MNLANLKTECDTLQVALLPDLSLANDPTRADYTPEEQKKIAAYCVMTHAEFEFFVEHLLREKLINTIKNIETNSSKQIIPSLCHQYGKNKTNKKLKINEAQEWYLKILADNHGIKESNIERMVFPLGFEISDFDPTLIAELNSFGTTRGNFAHNSFTKVTRQIPNPKDINDRVNNILNMLKDFEAIIRIAS